MSDFEKLLSDLPDAVDWPQPSEHLVVRVGARIQSRRAQPKWLRWVLAGVVAAVVVLVGLVPGSRQAVADLLHEAGVRIGFISETPSEITSDLDLGTPVTIEAAVAQVEFELRSPEILGSPEGVFVDDAMISMVWDGPVLLTQRSSGGTFAQKNVGPGTSATGVDISGHPGLWIEGAGHTFTLLDEQGNPVDETARLAANVLLWDSGSADYRLELDGDLDRALEIATSLESSD